MEAVAELAAVDDVSVGDRDLGDRGSSDLAAVPPNTVKLYRGDCDPANQTSALFSRGRGCLAIVEVRVVFLAFVRNQKQDLGV